MSPSAGVWAGLATIWLLTLAALVWGRTKLARNEVLKGLAWTAGASMVAFFVMWAAYAHCAGFNPQPKSSAATTGRTFAMLLFPFYSALLACIAFAFVIQAARTRGAPQRPLIVRLLAGLFLVLVVIAAVCAVGLGCFFAAGPKAMG